MFAKVVFLNEINNNNHKLLITNHYTTLTLLVPIYRD